MLPALVSLPIQFEELENRDPTHQEFIKSVSAQALAFFSAVYIHRVTVLLYPGYRCFTGASGCFEVLYGVEGL